MYTNHYNLNEKPFNLTPDPDFLYLAHGHREALASMTYGVKERKGIISITGEVGTGKTTLIYTLLKNLDKNVITVYIYHTNITFEQILNKILIELNIISFQTDKISLLQCFNDYLIEKLAKDQIIAIIIDEAQNLEADVLEELRMLTNLETGKSKLLQLILVGQPELENILNSDNLRQLKQRISIRARIVPLTFHQSEEYIKHRLNLAGCKSNIFNKKAISRICEHSKGIPRNINIICDNALLIGFAKSKRKINIDIINEVIKDIDDIFIIKPDNITSNKTITGNYQTSNSINYYKPAVFILLILLISIIFLINRSDFLIQNSPEPSKSSNITLLNEQDLSDTLTKDIESKSKPDVSSQMINSANASPPMELTDTNNTTATTVNVNSKSEPLNLMQTAKVQNGATVFFITLKYYNNISTTLAYIILKANPNIKDINEISIDQEIIIPRITLETPLIKISDNTYNIELGTFASINKAKKLSKETMLSDNKIKIIPKKVSLTDTWYQVVLEKNASKKECLSTVELLKEEGLLACFNDLNLAKKSSGLL